MRKERIYIDIDSLSYWWGVYGLSRKVDWEDITIYQHVEKEFKRIARTCICTRNYFEDGLNELEHDPDETDYVNRVKKFLKGNSVVYSYSYDNPESEDFYEVPFEATRNEIGIKPSYIEIWHPSDLIDNNVVKECVALFCDKFLNLSVSEVLFKNIVSIETATDEFLKFMEEINDGIKMVFSDKLIEQLEKEWGKPRGKIMEILNRSIK